MSARDDLVAARDAAMLDSAIAAVRYGADGTMGVRLTPPECIALLALLDAEPVAWTHKKQPDNLGAWRLGEACQKAADEPKCGDYIDRGLILLRELQERGYGVVSLPARPEASDE